MTDESTCISNAFVENGVLFTRPSDYLVHLCGPDLTCRGSFTEEMWSSRSFEELFSLLARRTIEDVKKLARRTARSRYNIILNVDSYKISMPWQYPEGTRKVYSYIESRGGQYDRTVMAGLQMFADEYLTVRVTHEMVDEAVEVYREHGVAFYEGGWRYIVDEHGGRLPIEIRAVDEGTVVSTRNVLATIVNTDNQCWWLTTHIETSLLRAIWYPTTVASRSFAARRVIKRWLDTTSDVADAVVDSRLHDFGARGATSAESAEIGGLGHLMIFRGTDTVGALAAARRHYGAAMPGRSVNAAEHSTITSYGREGEVTAYRKMLQLFARPGSYVSVVSDSYDLWNAVDVIWGRQLRQEVIDSGATVVVRPDSGDVETVPVEVVRRLAATFGFTTNSKGYRVLKHTAVLQGDGIDDEQVIDRILANLAAAGFSAENIAFGMGGGLLQKLNRDTQMFAMKCSAIYINGEWREVYKQPSTDSKKVSKRGRMVLVHGDGWETLPMSGNENRDELHQVFYNGLVTRRTTLDQCRERVASAA